MSIIANKHKRTGWLMNKTKGFTLIEVLIAVLLLTGGLLGLAALQTASLRSNLTAYNRGQATQLLYDMADRIRANRTATATYTTALGTNPSLVAACNATTSPKDCTPAALANNDLIQWNAAIASTLPMGVGTITTGNGGVLVLGIQWDDNRSGTVTSDDPTFRMSLQL